MMMSEARVRSSSTTRHAVALARSDFTLISSGGAIAATMIYDGPASISALIFP